MVLTSHSRMPTSNRDFTGNPRLSCPSAQFTIYKVFMGNSPGWNVCRLGWRHRDKDSNVNLSKERSQTHGIDPFHSARSNLRVRFTIDQSREEIPMPVSALHESGLDVHPLQEEQSHFDALTATILDHLNEQAVISLDTLISLMPQYTWNQIFHHVDRLSRSKQLVLRRHRFEYLLFSVQFAA